MIALFAAAWFGAVQYTPHPLSLRGCTECAGEADDKCEVHAGIQQGEVEWVGDRIRLLRPSSEARCAVPAKTLLKGPLELAAVRSAASAPSSSLLAAIKLRAPVRGWPLRHAKSAAVEAAVDRGALRLSVLCWPSDRGWPAHELNAANACEWWLLAHDLSGASFALAEPAFAFGDAKWARVFDRSAPLDESLFVAAPVPAPPPQKKQAAAKCGEAARERTATMDRFDQWDLQIRRAQNVSLDRAALRVDAAAWSGHCQELEVLRAALEKQLDCAVPAEGECR